MNFYLIYPESTCNCKPHNLHNVTRSIMTDEAVSKVRAEEG